MGASPASRAAAIENSRPATVILWILRPTSLLVRYRVAGVEFSTTG